MYFKQIQSFFYIFYRFFRICPGNVGLHYAALCKKMIALKKPIINELKGTVNSHT